MADERRAGRVDASAYVHPTAVVCGDVTIGARASVWPVAVIRADSAEIVIGDETNVQDGAVIHVDAGVPCAIGARVAIGHRAIVHGATIEGGCLVGMGAIVLNRAHVGTGSIVGAGALCPEGMVIPPGSLVIGLPGRIVRQTTAEERARIERTVDNYLAMRLRHERGEFPLLPNR